MLDRRIVDFAIPVAAGIVCVAAASGLVLVVGSESQTKVLAAGGVAALSLWALTTRHPMRAVAVAALYIGLLDGFVKLRIDSTSATLLRDVLLYAALINLALRHSSGAVTRWPPGTGWVALFVVAVVVQFANPEMSGPVQIAGGIRLHLEFLPLFFVGALYLRNATDLRNLMLIVVVMGAANSVANIVQFSLSPDQFAAWGPGYAAKVFGTESGAGRVAFGSGADTTTIIRPFGLGSDIGFGGTMALMAIPMAIHLALNAGANVRSVSVFGALAVLNVVGVVTSQTRVVVIAAVVAVVVYLLAVGLSRRALRVIALTTVALTVSAVLLPVVLKGSGSATTDRLESITPSRLLSSTEESRGSTLDIIPKYFATYPFGSGIGQSGGAASLLSSNASRNAESEVTFLLIETGVAGLLAIFMLNLSVMRAGFRRHRGDSSTERSARAALAAPFVGMFAIWIAAPATAGAPFAAYFWLGAGVILQSAHSARRVRWSPPQTNPRSAGA